jgi:transposase
MAVAGVPKKRFKTIAGGDYVALGQAIEECKTKWGLDVAAPVVFCYEAGRDGFYPYRLLTAAGHTVWVIDSASIEVSRRQRRAKSQVAWIKRSGIRDDRSHEALHCALLHAASNPPDLNPSQVRETVAR